MDFHTLRVRASFLSTLRGLADKPILSAYREVLHALSQDVYTFGEAYGALCERIYQYDDAGERILHLIECDNNALTASLDNPSAACWKPPPGILKPCLHLSHCADWI